MKVKCKPILQYILIYLMFLGNRSGLLIWMYRENGWPVAIVISILCIGICAITNGTLSKSLICFMGILAMIFAVVFITTRGIGIYTYFDIIAWPLLMYTAYKIERKNYIERYINVIVFFALISVICFIIQQTNLETLLNFLGVPYNDLMFTYYGKWFYTYTAGHAYRNMGMYTEPGLFQIVLNSALFILLYMGKSLSISKKKKKVEIIILIVTCFTTLSTTGLLTMAVILLGTLFTKEKKKKEIIVLIIACIAFLSYNYVMLGDESIITMYIIDKLQTTGTAQLAAQSHLSSGNARFMAFYVAAKCVMSYPLGAGYYNYKSIASAMGYPDIAGNGIAFYGSVLGVVGVCVILYQVLKMAWKFKPNNNAFIIFTLMYALYATSQEYLVVPAILIIPYAFRRSFELMGE